MAARATVRWNESKQQWTAWVRFPEGTRRVERVEKANVEEDLRERIEGVFKKMAAAGYATSTVDRTWVYLNQACQYARRQRQIRTNPAQDVLLPAARPP